MSDERHRALKRWERAKQLAAVHADPVLTGPPAWCRIKSPASAPERIPVYIASMFSKDLTCVKACKEPVPEGLPGPWWLVRGGIRWDEYLRGIVRHYGAGLPVPDPFRPVRKIGPAIIDHLATLPDEALPAVFAKLRESALLPQLPDLRRETCPQALAWENIRASFQDFLGEAWPAG